MLFSGAKDDSVTFVSLCLCVSAGRIMWLEMERVIALSAAQQPQRLGTSLLCGFFFFFAYLLAECANFTGPVKGGEGQLRAMWLMA